MPQNFRRTHNLFSKQEADAPIAVRELGLAQCRVCLRTGSDLNEFPCEIDDYSGLTPKLNEIVGDLLGKLDRKTVALDGSESLDPLDLDELLLHRASAEMIRLLLGQILRQKVGKKR